MSSAPASWQSPEARIASISMWPMRPLAPATATWCRRCGRRRLRRRHGHVCSASRHAASAAGLRAAGSSPAAAGAARRRASAGGGGRAGGEALAAAPRWLRSTGTLARLALVVQRGDELGFAGHGVALEALQRVVLEEHRQPALLRLDALALEREHVVPAVAVEQARAPAACPGCRAPAARLMPGLSASTCSARDEVALHDFDLVGRDRRRRCAGWRRRRCRSRRRAAQAAQRPGRGATARGAWRAWERAGDMIEPL